MIHMTLPTHPVPVLTPRSAIRRCMFPLAVCIGFAAFSQEAIRSGNARSTPRDDQRPTGLMCELMSRPELTVVTDQRPSFSWIVPLTVPADAQTAYRVLVSSTADALARDEADLWDSGRVESADSVAVRYAGATLPANAPCFWKVRTWNRDGQPGEWSAVQEFRTAKRQDGTAVRTTTARYPLVQTEVRPVRVVRKGRGEFFVDFGRAAFGTVRLTAASAEAGVGVTVRLGEKLGPDDTVDPRPGGTIRFRQMTLPLEPGTHTYRVQIPRDKRNTGRAAIKMPEATGEVMPFRYCEIEGLPGDPAELDIVQIAVHYPFDDAAADFRCSDETLNAVWDLCKYSIKATSFCGVYVDGDRERIPYEADAYINQLCHYCVDREFTLARYSHEYLIQRPTWPTEWPLHSVLMAWADYLYTGDLDSARAFYDDLKAKTLHALAREDGLISTQTGLVTKEFLRSIHSGRIRDIVDWPGGERDGYAMAPINTVVNCFHHEALVLMGRLADALGNDQDAASYKTHAAKVAEAVNTKLVDPATGLYVDGEGKTHSALHANMFPLAFGLVPEDRRERVVEFVKSRGMACSVYAAQYLLEALYLAGEEEHALDLMRDRGKRGWYNMIAAGSTVSLEAWDIKYKPNLDWNHAWGAAPANIIPRFVLGVRPLEPGFGKVLIHPQPGSLSFAKGVVPTIRGPVSVSVGREGGSFRLTVSLPANMTARVILPRAADTAALTMDGQPASADSAGGRFVIDPVGAGKHEFLVK